MVTAGRNKFQFPSRKEYLERQVSHGKRFKNPSRNSRTFCCEETTRKVEFVDGRYISIHGNK